MVERARDWSGHIMREVHALYLASRDPRVPWYAKALAIGVTGYALSPLDPIPDFIPVLGVVDDLILIPFGIVLATKLVPSEIMAEHRAAASATDQGPVSNVAAGVIVVIWVLSIGLSAWLCYRLLARHIG